MKLVQPPDLRFTLIIDGEEYILPNAPSGWEDTVLNWARSTQYKGVIRTFTDRMTFVLDGAWLLRQAVYTKGIEALATLRVEALNRSDWSYSVIYTGEIDFSDFDDTLTGFEVNVMEGGFSKLLKAYEDVTFDIPLNGPESVEVRIPGVPLTENAELHVGADAFSPFTHDGGHFVTASPSVVVNVNEIPTGSIEVKNVVAVPEYEPDYPNDTNWFLRSITAIDEIRIRGNFSGTIGKNRIGVDSFKISIIAERGGLLYTVLVPLNESGTQSSTMDYSVDFDFNWDLQTDMKLFIVMTGPPAVISPVDPQNDLFIINGTINISHPAVTEDTLTRALTAEDLFKNLVNKINTNLAFPTQSFLLSAWRQLKITSGDAIRRIADRPQVIRTSFREFFDSMSAVLNAGFGVDNNTAVLEAEEYFYQPSNIVSLGEVSELVVTPAQEYLFSRIEAGYPDNNYEREQGRDEFNSEQTYTSPVTRVQNVYEARSVYRADQFGIEEVRGVTDLQNTEREDIPEDNDTFMIYTQATPGGDGVYDVEGREAFEEVTGIDPGTRYNMRISPKHNLLRHGRRLASAMYGMPTRSIAFTSGKKNVQLRTVEEGIAVTENENIPVSQLGDPLFAPFEARFQTKLPRNVQEVIELRKYGYVSFTWQGINLKGFILEVSADVAINTPREFRVLLTADSPIGQLAVDRRFPITT